METRRSVKGRPSGNGSRRKGNEPEAPGRKAGKAGQPRWVEMLISLLMGLVLVATLTLLLVAPAPSDQVRLQVGDVSPSDILAPRKISFESEVLTERARKQAEAAVPDVYDPPDLRIARQQVSRARDVLEYVDIVRHDPYTSIEEKAELISAVPDLAEVSPTVISRTLTMDEQSWRAVVTETLYVLNQALRAPIREEGVARAKQMLANEVDLSLSEEQAEAVTELARSFVRANSFLNAEATAANRAAAREAVPPVVRTIERGEAIIREGDIVTPEDMEALTALGMTGSQLEGRKLVGAALLLLTVLGVMGVYTWRIEPGFWVDQRRLLLVGLVVLAFAAVAKLMVPGHVLLPYLFPIPAAAMLLTVLVNPRLAVGIGLLLSVFAGLLAGGSLELAIYGIVGSIVATVSVWRVERLSSFFWAGLFVALTNLVLVLAFQTQSLAVDPLGLAQLGAVAIFNGGLAASITVAGFFVLGSLFNITTSVQLMDLARPNHPLLRQLQLKAPGTYHHSLLISNMAEQAAQSIGADALLSRVGGYYHDIGKIVRPYFFVENQVEGDNVHERLDPRTSAQVVIAHVREGVELAKKYGLPPAIRDFITQHHGTRLASFFYQRALQEDADNPPDEREFRYPGPKPQRKETAILMLADGAEAAVRAAKPRSKEEIDQAVRKIITDRLMAGDLDECDLTLRDLDKIREAFVSILGGVYHPRLEYPEGLEPVLESGTGQRPGLAGPGAEADSRGLALPEPSPESTPGGGASPPSGQGPQTAPQPEDEPGDGPDPAD